MRSLFERVRCSARAVLLHALSALLLLGALHRPALLRIVLRVVLRVAVKA
jgi:hypothetical protein